MSKHLAVSIIIVFSMSIAGLTTHIVAQEKKRNTISLDLKETSAEEAIKQLLKTNNSSCEMDDATRDSLKDTRVTASFQEVDFEQAVEMLASTLGLTATKKGNGYLLAASAQDDKHVVADDKEVIVKSAPPRGKTGTGSATIKVIRGRDKVNVRAFTYGPREPIFAAPRTRINRFSPQLSEPRVQVDAEPWVNVQPRFMGESVTCNQCKRTATIRSPLAGTEHQCPKCQRALRSDYKFCPYDGTELPASSTIRYCPYCGKELSKK